MKLTTIVFAILFSCTLYIGVFLFLVDKPLTIGSIGGIFEKKYDYLESITGNKLIILAGSNGRFSHRCETYEQVTNSGLPCANLSVTANLSLDYQFDLLTPYLEPGDIVYLPLEYGALAGDREQMRSGVELPYVVSNDHEYLFQMSVDRLLDALFYFDLRYFFSGLGEMTLQTLGIQRRFNLDTLTKQGDESTHTPEKGLVYRDMLMTTKWEPPGEEDFSEGSYKANIVSDFLKWAKENNVSVVGGLPTTFDDQPIPETLVLSICEFFKRNGQDFLLFENRNQYPRENFFDTPYHLLETYQIEHTKLITARLDDMLLNKQSMACK